MSSTSLQQQQQQQQESPLVATAAMSSSNDTDEQLDLVLEQTRRELQLLREQGRRRRIEQAQQVQVLSSHYQQLHSQLSKNANRLNMFLYTHAMCQAQTTVVQPYIVKKQALLCHAFHQNEVWTKQIHKCQLQSEQLVAVLENSIRQINDFWLPRLWQLQQAIRQTQADVQLYQQRMQRMTSSAPAVLSQQRTSADDSEVHHDVLVSVLSMALALSGFQHHHHEAPTAMRKPPTKKSFLDVIWEDGKKPTPAAPSSFVQRRNNMVGIATV